MNSLNTTEDCDTQDIFYEAGTLFGSEFAQSNDLRDYVMIAFVTANTFIEEMFSDEMEERIKSRLPESHSKARKKLSPREKVEAMYEFVKGFIDAAEGSIEV